MMSDILCLIVMLVGGPIVIASFLLFPIALVVVTVYAIKTGGAVQEGARFPTRSINPMNAIFFSDALTERGLRYRQLVTVWICVAVVSFIIGAFGSVSVV
jgi:hypothetical protein